MDLTPAYQLAASRMFLTKEDVDDIAELMLLCGKEAPIVVDIGAGTGNTALTVFLASPKAIVTTIDINKDNLCWAGLNLVGNSIEIDDSWDGIESDAADSAIYFDSGVVDILLHDSDHSESAVRKDLEAWLPKLRPGTLIWVHDYLPMPGAEEFYPGVKKVCDELVEQGYLEQIPITGIGFAAKVL